MGTKRIPVELNESEIRCLLLALSELPWSCEGVDSEQLEERLKEELATFGD